MRLDKLLHQAGFGSRNQVKKLIRARQVRIDGALALADSINVDTSFQTLEVAGKLVEMESHVYYLLNKPARVVTAVSDKEHPTVIDLIDEKDRRKGLYPIGRLDRDTEGLLLVTDNGPLGFRMLHPKHHVEKVYRVCVNGWIDDRAVQAFKVGVVFHDGKVCKSAQLKILSASSTESWAEISLSEGKFHQVKKMFLTVGVKVTYLKRIAFGPFHLDKDLASGDYRTLRAEELGLLREYFD